MFTIGYYTTSSPLYGAKLAFWRHHEVLFNRMCKNDNVRLLVVLPCYGGSKLITKLYEGDRSVLYPSLREMDISFPLTNNPPDSWDDLDALYLDDICEFSDLYIKTNRGTWYFSKYAMETYLIDLIDHIGRAHKPIVLSDTDGFCYEVLEGKHTFMMKIYEHLMSHMEYNWYIISPFKISEEHVPPERTRLIPFEVDEYALNDIVPVSQRPYFCRLVKNMYYNEYYIPLLRGMAVYGPTLVNGNGWGQYATDPRNADIQFKVAIPMTPSNVNNVYSSARIAPLGNNTQHLAKGRELFQYRWKEYLQAGVFIVPEDLKSYTDILPAESLITMNDFGVRLGECYGHSRDKIQRIVDANDKEYEQLVQAQRESALKYLSATAIELTFKELFGL